MKNLLVVTLFTFFSIGLIAQSDILPPELNAPDSAATKQMADVELDWYPVNGVGLVTYNLQIDTDDQFQDPFTITTPNSAYKTSNLTFGGHYFWRVKAMDDTGEGGWSSVNSFTVMDIILLQDPANGTEGVAPDVKLSWSNRQGANVISGISNYYFQICLDTNFTDIYYSDSIIFGTLPDDTAFYFTNAANLLFSTEFFWRVRAEHEEDACEWSEIRSFVTLGDVNLLSPADNAINQDVDISLLWQEITGIDSYIYQVCTDPDFTFPCITGFVDNSFPGVSIPNLGFGGINYWRVKAAHSMDTTAWSEQWSFEVINTVILLSPADGASGLPTLPTLTWDGINGVDEYEVIWYDEDLTYIDTAFVPGEFNSIILFKPLEVGKDYNWKVKAKNDDIYTNWSEIWQFHVGSQDIQNSFLNKANINLHPNPSNGYVTIELNAMSQKAVKISVVDLMGKTVLENSYIFDQGLNQKNISLTHLENGIYLIKFQTEGEMFTEKLIIDK